MPGGDRTGPRGMGPMTGRAAGYCAGYDVPGYMNPVQGFGRGAGWGGRGWRNMYYATGLPAWARGGAYPSAAPYAPTGVPYGAPPTTEQEVEALTSQSEYLEGMLKDINSRIEQLRSATESKGKKE